LKYGLANHAQIQASAIPIDLTEERRITVRESDREAERRCEVRARRGYVRDVELRFDRGEVWMDTRCHSVVRHCIGS
jgi:hypothetical protein